MDPRYLRWGTQCSVPFVPAHRLWVRGSAARLAFVGGCSAAAERWSWVRLVRFVAPNSTVWQIGTVIKAAAIKLFAPLRVFRSAVHALCGGDQRRIAPSRILECRDCSIAQGGRGGSTMSTFKQQKNTQTAVRTADEIVYLYACQHKRAPRSATQQHVHWRRDWTLDPVGRIGWQQASRRVGFVCPDELVQVERPALKNK